MRRGHRLCVAVNFKGTDEVCCQGGSLVFSNRRCWSNDNNRRQRQPKGRAANVRGPVAVLREMKKAKLNTNKSHRITPTLLSPPPTSTSSPLAQLNYAHNQPLWLQSPQRFPCNKRYPPCGSPRTLPWTSCSHLTSFRPKSRQSSHLTCMYVYMRLSVVA